MYNYLEKITNLTPFSKVGDISCFFILLKHNIYNRLKSVLILVEIQYQLDEMRCMLVFKNNQNFKPKLYKINTTRMHEIRQHIFFGMV